MCHIYSSYTSYGATFFPLKSLYQGKILCAMKIKAKFSQPAKRFSCKELLKLVNEEKYVYLCMQLN